MSQTHNSQTHNIGLLLSGCGEMNAGPAESALLNETVPSQVLLGLQLCCAYEYANDCALQHVGLRGGNRCDERGGPYEHRFCWLVCQGYLEHAREITTPEDNSREFRQQVALAFTKQTCFVLTKAGMGVVRPQARVRTGPVMVGKTLPAIRSRTPWSGLPIVPPKLGRSDVG